VKIFLKWGKITSFTLFLGVLIIFTFSQLASAASDIPIENEYADGIITQPDSTMKISYAWVNTENASLLSLAMFDDTYKVALFRPFFGQSFKVDDSSFFVGTILTGFELFQDQNGNDALDLADELKYYIMLNASQYYVLPSIEKTTSDGVEQYSWKICYLEIDGFFQPMGDNIARTIIDSVNLSYTYEVYSNHTELKLTIEMGNWDAYEFDFDNDGKIIRLNDIDLSDYSLSLLFGTTVSSEEPFSLTLMNGTTGLEDMQIKVNDIPIFQSLFKDSYDLGLNGSAYQAKTVPASVDTLYDDQLQVWGTPESFYNWWSDFFGSISDLTTVPAIGLEEVSFLYRICYPIWSGEPFNHDPRYRALFEGEITEPGTTTTTTPTNTPTIPTDIPSLELPISLLALSLVLIPISRKRKN
jgi:hypothetical protein